MADRATASRTRRSNTTCTPWWCGALYYVQRSTTLASDISRSPEAQLDLSRQLPGGVVSRPIEFATAKPLMSRKTTVESAILPGGPARGRGERHAERWEQAPAGGSDRLRLRRRREIVFPWASCLREGRGLQP
jgi:hypothetical protein